MADSAENDVPIGYVQEANWGEWAATCAVPRCGWTFSQGNRTQADAEQHMRNHAAIVHPPRIPVYRVNPPVVGDHFAEEVRRADSE